MTNHNPRRRGEQGVEEKPVFALPDTDQPKTDALKNLEQNLERLKKFLDLLHPENLERSAKALTRLAERLAGRFKADPKNINKKNIAALTRAVDTHRATTSDYLAVSQLSHEWIGVMLVTFIETYLEDGLISVAVVNPTLMKGAMPIDHNRILEADSLDELRQETRREWAHQRIDGGPRKFVRRLKDMGARGYDEKDIFRMEHLWDTRNLIVHSNGVVNVAYVKKYKHLQTGGRVKVNLAQLTWWLEALGPLVECTDRFFLNYGSQKTEGNSVSVA